MPASDQFRAQFGVVINLTVEHNPNRLVFVMNRLVTGRQVNDRQPTHAERDAGHESPSLVVRAAVANRLAHTTKGRVIVSSGIAVRVPFATDVRVREACYSTHMTRSLSFRACACGVLRLSLNIAVRSRCKSAAEVAGPKPKACGPFHPARVAPIRVRLIGSDVADRRSTAICASVWNSFPQTSIRCTARGWSGWHVAVAKRATNVPLSNVPITPIR